MSDLFKGQSMSACYPFISAGTAHTFTFPFQADKVVFNNLTDWAATAANLPKSTWFRGKTTAAHAFQEQVIDSAAASSFNFLDLSTNGFTSANTSGGASASQATISGATAADPCVITHSAFTFQTNQLVRITDLGPVGGATDRGMDELNNKRYRIVVVNSTSFSLKDPVSGEAIDSSAFVAYVSGGRVTLETHVNQLNNPQVSPYASTPYVPNSFSYDPVEYKLTAGTSVMGADSDQFVIEVYKFGLYSDLGDLLT